MRTQAAGWIFALAFGMAGVFALAGAAQAATAVLTDASGAKIGKAVFKQEQDGLRITLDATHLPPGVHGIHLHETGKCDAPDFKSAGGHFNPTHAHHGFDNPEGPHMGDLPNVTVNADGVLFASFTAAGVRLKGGDHPLLDEDGAALVIHAGPDDNKSDPAGNSGARIACGVIGK